MSKLERLVGTCLSLELLTGLPPSPDGFAHGLAQKLAKSYLRPRFTVRAACCLAMSVTIFAAIPLIISNDYYFVLIL